MDLYDLNEIPDHLKSYFEPAPQIGLEETPEQFIQKMVDVFHEVKRVTRDDGILWLNFGYSYAGSGCGCLKPKDLMGIPWRVAFALQADGWYFRSAMPWIKRSCMPESTTDRPTSAIEYIFLMTKSAKYFYDGDAVRVGCEPTTLERNNYKRTRKQNGGGSDESLKTVDQMPLDFGDMESTGTRNYRNSDPFFESWQGLYSESENPLAFVINPQSRPELHFATFPDLLAATCIKAGTSEYGCCPVCGAPWERVVEKEQIESTKDHGISHKDHFPSRSQSCIRDGKGRIGDNNITTTGWRPG